MSTPERSTLAQRMEQARLRTIAARTSHGPAPAPAPGSVMSGHKITPVAESREGAWMVGAAAGDQVVLMPGQAHFGGLAASVQTLLGSCVAVTLWHPTRRIGGMCHYLLPSRHRVPGELDGRYGDEALEGMVSQIRLHRTDPSEYHAHLYGGADTMPEGTGLKFNVGERNIELGWTLIDRYGFQLQGVDVGEDIPRNVHLALATGAVDMRRGIGKVASMQSPAPTRKN